MQEANKMGLAFIVMLILCITAALIPTSLGPIDTKPILTAEPAGVRMDYILHVILFWVLGLVYTMSAGNTDTNILPFLLGVFGLLLFAILMEALHYVISWRGYNLMDMLANIGGLFAGILTGGVLNAFVFSKSYPKAKA